MIIQKKTTIQGQWQTWLTLQNELEAEAWLQLQNHELHEQLIAAKLFPQSLSLNQGQGIAFQLVHGGEIICHTNSDGDILLDVSEDADWCNPVISACTGVVKPAGRIWLLPADVLIQLVLGLNSLIAASCLVIQHRFK